MALIRCPECGKEVSDTVKHCPECGYSIRRYTEKMQEQEEAYENAVKRFKKPSYPEIPQNTVPSIIYLYISIFAFILGIIMFVFGLDSYEDEIALIGGCILFPGGMLGIYFYFRQKSIAENMFKEQMRDYEREKQEYQMADEDFEKYKQYKIQQLYEQELAIIRWENISNSQNNFPKCPTCGSFDVKKISGTKRWVSTGLYGVASSSIGKTMECNRCGYKW